jgi:hypothetical protein
MKLVALDKTHVDYFQSICASGRGLTSCFGIRVEEGRCVFLAKIGDESASTFGKYYPLPAAPETLPSHLRIIVDDHLLNYPSSDLAEVLAGKKSFQEALDWPVEGESQRITATGRVRFAHSS